ncbi:probable disease resistance protein At4g27220 [Mercurialis annua]|uniref:probable disease resistance protein At4g27220 n=1 Tax=Mercurialis annua TaxID=3986 RepID=UPI0021604527|nr:probable disease resistance protein At4g27220 [Mercurialis annua]XP_055960559.1 probable disease resistance protein At4g27220 [Mercurialis annua]
MAENIGISIGSKIAEILVEPVVCQLRYAFCFNNFVKDLKKQEKKLSLTHNRVRNDIDASIRNTEDIEKDVEAWVEDSRKAIEVVRYLELEIEKEKRCFISWCPNWIWQYRLSRKIAKRTTNLIELQDKGKFQRVSYHSTLPCIELLSKDFMPSLSAQQALKQIMEALRDNDVRMIGLHGMGGVGKTTLVKEVGKQANELKLFDKVLMLVVSQAQDIIQLQDQLADKLFLYMPEKTKEGRANRIWKRLKQEKKILIILDDIWKYLDLKDIGIPFDDDQNGLKILLTTRLQHVCTSMECQKEIPLHVLTDDEAWALFKKNAGLPDESSTLTSVAIEVAKECKGLPIAIVTLGRALRGKSFEGWQLASRKLKASRLTDIRDVNKDENAYTCLRLSFDYLQRKETKFCFLMCSLFPEDYEIPIEQLVGYAVGLGLYEDACSIEETRSEVFESICDLKASCMLLETEKEEHVKMHDIIRDFALWIGSSVESGFMVRSGNVLEEQLRTESLKKYTAISLMDSNVRQLADGLNCPELKVLLLGRKGAKFMVEEDSSDTEEDTTNGNEAYVNVPSTCFSGMKELKVLSLTHGIISIHSLEYVTNLQTLGLKNCKINCLTSLQKLKSLQILNLHGSSIKELPEEIGELSDLRLMDLTCCEKLERILPNTIRRLSKLEELYIGVSSFRKWQIEETSNQTINASLMELNSLSHLAVLWLYVTKDHIPVDFAFPNLNRYRIQINHGIIDDEYPSRPGNPTSRSIDFFPCSVSIVNSCKELFLNAYDLRLDGNAECFQNIIPDIDQKGFNQLISLNFFLCDLDCLISTTNQQVPPAAFSNLQQIHLGKTSLKEICDGEPPQKFLEKLQTLEIFVSYGLTIIFPAKLWRALQNLEKVVVHYCESLQEAFQLDELDGTKKELLSRLLTLKLEHLPELEYIWKGPTHHVNLKSLTYLKLDGCNRLTSIFSPWLAHTLVQLETIDISHCKQLEHIIAEKDDEGQETLSSSHMESLSLRKLKTLKIHGCDELEYVFPMSFAKELFYLEEIYIASVAELKQFFGKRENGTASVPENDNLLCQSEEKSLMTGYFSSGNCSAVLPYLQHVEFKGCPKFSMDSIIKIPTPHKASTCSAAISEGRQLKTLTITGCAELEHVIVQDNDNRDHVSLRCHFQVVCFSNLLHIRVYRCIRLKKLFPITISEGLPCLKYFELIEAGQLGEVFEGNEEADNDEKEILMAKLVRLTMKELPSLTNFCPRGYHFVFPCLETLTVEGCPLITTSFKVASNCSVHATTEKPQVVEQDMAITADAALRNANDGINWKRCEQNTGLLPYVEDEDRLKVVQVVENSSNSVIESTNHVTKKKKRVKRGEQSDEQDDDSRHRQMGCCLTRGG